MRLTPTSDGFTSPEHARPRGAGHGNERDAADASRRVAVCHDGDGAGAVFCIVWNRAPRIASSRQTRTYDGLVVHAPAARVGHAASATLQPTLATATVLGLLAADHY